MSDEQEGPVVQYRIQASCKGCVHLKCEYYVHQSDSGYESTCMKLDHPWRIPHFSQTPWWCSLAPEAYREQEKRR